MANELLMTIGVNSTDASDEKESILNSRIGSWRLPILTPHQLNRVSGVVIILILLTLAAAFQPAEAIAAAIYQKTWGGNKDDIAHAVALDSSGAVYVTGISFSFGGAFLLKYNATTGTLIFQKVWKNSMGAYAYGVAANANGDIYVTGETITGSGSNDHTLILLKFDSNGSLLWQITWGTAAFAQGIAIDQTGNIYVTGIISSNSTNYSFYGFLLKFQGNGSLLWQRLWGGSNDNTGMSVATDLAGNAYVTGYANGVGAIILKFDSTGSLDWSEGAPYLLGVAVTTDYSSNVYALAICTDLCVLKLNSAGSELWEDVYSAAYWGFTPTSITVGTSGSVFVSAYEQYAAPGSSSSPIQAIVLKLNPLDGNLTGQKSWGGRSGVPGIVPNDKAFGIAVDGFQNFYAVGSLAEAPPYSFNNPAGNLAHKHPSFKLTVTPTFNSYTSTSNATGTISNATGSQDYSAGEDVFLVKAATTAITVPIQPITPLLLVVPLIYLAVKVRKIATK